MNVDENHVQGEKKNMAILCLENRFLNFLDSKMFLSANFIIFFGNKNCEKRTSMAPSCH